MSNIKPENIVRPILLHVMQPNLILEENSICGRFRSRDMNPEPKPNLKATCNQ